MAMAKAPCLARCGASVGMQYCSQATRSVLHARATVAPVAGLYCYMLFEVAVEKSVDYMCKRPVMQQHTAAHHKRTCRFGEAVTGLF